MKTLNGSSPSGIPPNGTPGQFLVVDPAAQPAWQTTDLGLTTVNFNDSPYLVYTTAFIGRSENTQIDVVATGTGPNLLTSDASETLNLAFKSNTEKVTLKADAASSTYTLQLPPQLPSDTGYLKVRANGTSLISVPLSAQFFSTATQTIPGNTPTTILFPSNLTSIPGVTYLNGTFTLTTNCVCHLASSVPVASVSALKRLYILKNASLVRYGETTINDVPASIESLQTSTILNFSAGDTFRVIILSTNATSTTFNAGVSLGHVQIDLF